MIGNPKDPTAHFGHYLCGHNYLFQLNFLTKKKQIDIFFWNYIRLKPSLND